MTSVRREREVTPQGSRDSHPPQGPRHSCRGVIRRQECRRPCVLSRPDILVSGAPTFLSGRHSATRISPPLFEVLSAPCECPVHSSGCPTFSCAPGAPTFLSGSCCRSATGMSPPLCTVEARYSRLRGPDIPVGASFGDKNVAAPVYCRGPTSSSQGARHSCRGVIRRQECRRPRVLSRPDILVEPSILRASCKKCAKPWGSVRIVRHGANSSVGPSRRAARCPWRTPA